MERRLEEPIATAAETGFSLVPWDEGHGMAIRAVHNAAFADHWGSVPMGEDAWKNIMLDSPGFRADLSYVAVAEEQIVGYAYNEVYEEDWESAGQSEAWIGALGVLREWRKRGIATALLNRSMDAMRRAGMEAAMIGVDSSSPSGAQHLYQSVGFLTKTTGTTWQREIT
jgi:ribosomal protein S18 acetylase RimI-like enzyme